MLLSLKYSVSIKFKLTIKAIFLLQGIFSHLGFLVLYLCSKSSFLIFIEGIIHAHLVLTELCPESHSWTTIRLYAPTWFGLVWPGFDHQAGTHWWWLFSFPLPRITRLTILLLLYSNLRHLAGHLFPQHCHVLKEWLKGICSSCMF